MNNSSRSEWSSDFDKDVDHSTSQKLDVQVYICTFCRVINIIDCFLFLPVAPLNNTKNNPEQKLLCFLMRKKYVTYCELFPRNVSFIIDAYCQQPSYWDRSTKKKLTGRYHRVYYNIHPQYLDSTFVLLSWSYPTRFLFFLPNRD